MQTFFMNKTLRLFLFFCGGVFISQCCIGQTTQDTLKPIEIYFSKKAIALDKSSKKRLDSLAARVERDTTIGLSLMVYYADLCSDCGARAWDRMENMTNYLVKKGVPADRIRSTGQLGEELNKVTVGIEPWSRVKSFLLYPRGAGRKKDIEL
jgi:hypothetical protein